jgi:hypothetical protein
VSWRSSKQSVSTRSTKEAELVALDSAALEAEWLRDLLSDLPMLAKPIPTVLVYCDNTSVLLKVNSRKDNQNPRGISEDDLIHVGMLERWV